MKVGMIMMVFGVILLMTNLSTAELEFVKTDVGFGHGCTEYIVTNPYDSLLSTAAVPDENKLRVSGWNEVYGAVRDSYWQEYVLLPHEIQTWIPDVSCRDSLSVNGTTRVCEDNGGYENNTVYRGEWVSLNTDSLSFSARQAKKVRFCADYEMERTTEAWKMEVDHIPSFLGTSYPEYAWHNVSLGFCLPVTLTPGFDASYTHELHFNTTDHSGNIYANAQSDFSDVRILEGTCSNPTGSELGIWNETVNVAGDSIIWVMTDTANASGLAIYYGNTTPVSSTFNISEAFLFADDFQDGTLDAVKWSNNADNADEAGGVLRVHGTCAANVYEAVNGTSTYGEGHAIELRAKLDNSGAQKATIIWGTTSASSPDYGPSFRLADWSGAGSTYYMKVQQDTAANGVISGQFSNINDYTRASFFHANSTYAMIERYQTDGVTRNVLEATTASHIPDVAIAPYIGAWKSGSASTAYDVYVDWVGVRKWNSDNSTVVQSFGSEETSNQAPVVNEINLTPVTPVHAYTDLNCSYFISDADASDTHVNISGFWYLNGSIQNNLNFTQNNSPINITNYSVLSSGNTTNNYENWSCSITAYDAGGASGSNTSVNRTIFNYAPSYSGHILDDYTPYYDENIICYATLIDQDTLDNETLRYNLTWFKDGVEDISVAGNNINNNTQVSHTLISGNTSVGESWICQLNVSDGINYTMHNTSAAVIQNYSYPDVHLTSPADAYVSSATSITFKWICNDSETPTLTAKLYIAAVEQISQSCTDDVECSYTETDVHTCDSHNWYVTCEDGDGRLNNSVTRSFSYAMDISYTGATPANASTVDNADSVTMQAQLYCTPKASNMTFHNWLTAPANYTTTCTDNVCYITNASRVTGNYSFNAWFQDYSNVWYEGANRTFFSETDVDSGSIFDEAVEVDLEWSYNYSNITTADFTTYMRQFYIEDWGSYILAILCFGLSFLFTKNYSQTMTAGGIGLIFIWFLMSANVLFLAGGILSLILGYSWKIFSG